MFSANWRRCRPKIEAWSGEGADAEAVVLDASGAYLQDYTMVAELPAIYAFRESELHVVVFL